MDDVTRSAADDEQAIRRYACEVVGCSPKEILATRRFGSGERHAVHRVTYVGADDSQGDIVVRVSLSDSAKERGRAEHEARVLDKVQGIAAPRLLDFRLDSSWFASPCFALEFVAGSQREFSATEAADFENLGRVVGRLHRLPVEDLVQPDTTTFDGADYRTTRVERVMNDMRWVRDPLDPRLQDRLRRAMSTIEERPYPPKPETKDGERLVLLHGDIASGNVIWGAEPVLIDWEYARFGDPADEIAYLFSQAELAALHRGAFWRGYAPPQDRLNRLVEVVQWWEPVTLVASALWWIERATRRADADANGRGDPNAPRAVDHYLTHARRRLDAFDQTTR